MLLSFVLDHISIRMRLCCTQLSGSHGVRNMILCSKWTFGNCLDTFVVGTTCRGILASKELRPGMLATSTVHRAGPTTKNDPVPNQWCLG